MSTVPTPKPAATRHALPALISLVVFLSFLPVLHNDFVNWDDPLNFAGNPHYRGLSPSHLRWMFTTMYMGHYQPLTWVTHGLVYTIWGMNPFGYHLVNLLLHVANAVVFYFVVVALLRAAHGTDSPAHTPGMHVAAAVGALFFAIHPLRVESVAWATERRDVLSGFFILWTVLAYLRTQEERRAGCAAWKWYVLSVGCFALSLLSKVAGMTLPVVLLLLDLYPLRRLRRDGGEPIRVLVEKLPYVVLLGGAAAVALRAADLISMTRHGPLQRAAEAAYGLCFYARKTLLPFHLSPLYVLETPLNPADTRYVLSALTVVGAAIVLFLLRRRYPWALLAAASYGVMVSPVLGFVHSGPQITADRYSYLPCLPFAVLAAAGVYQLWQAAGSWRLGHAGRYAAAAAVTLALAGLAARTFQQTRVWHDSLTLWTHAVQLDPTNYFAYNNRGTARQLRGDLDGALADFDEALRLHPDYGKAAANRGNIRLATGDVDGALADLTLALYLEPEEDPAYANIYTSRGRARQAKGDLAAAADDFSHALQLNPDDAEAYYGRANTRSLTGDLAGAIADYGAALRLNPQLVDAYINRGNARQAQRDLGGAVADFSEALRLDPQRADAYYNRGNARSAQRDLRAAIADYTAAVALNPRYANAYFNRGNTRRTLGDLNGALADITRAFELAPADEPSRAMFARALARVRREVTASNHDKR